MVYSSGPDSLFYMWYEYHFLSTICGIDCSFSIELFLHTFRKAVVDRYMCSVLDSQFFLIVSFEIGKCESFMSFFSQGYYNYCGFLAVLYEFEDCVFHFYKKSCWNFDRDCIEFVDYFGYSWWKWILESVNIWCLFTYLGLLKFLLNIFCSFPCTNL